MTTFCAQRRRLWWAILCGLVGISVAQTTTDLQDDPSFIGYYIAVSSTQVLTVGEGKSWVTSGTFAGDCSGTTACTFATACGDNTITYGNGDTDSCGDASCVEFTIFQTSPFGLPSALNIGCRIGWTANTVYRELDAGTTTEATTTTTAKTPSTNSQATSTANTGISATAGSSATSITSTASITPTTESASSDSTAVASTTGSDNSEKQTSKAWIAGAAVGGVAGAALLGLLVWFLLRRKRQEPGLTAVPQAEEPKYDQGAPAGYGQGYYSDQVHEYYAKAGQGYHPHELDGVHAQQTQELPAFKPPSELP